MCCCLYIIIIQCQYYKYMGNQRTQPVLQAAQLQKTVHMLKTDSIRPPLLRCVCFIFVLVLFIHLSFCFGRLELTWYYICILVISILIFIYVVYLLTSIIRNIQIFFIYAITQISVYIRYTAYTIFLLYVTTVIAQPLLQGHHLLSLSQLIKQANQVTISYVSEQFYNYSSKSNQAKPAESIGLKIILDLHDISYEHISVVKPAQLHQYEGQYIEITPMGHTRQVNGRVKLWQMTISVQQDQHTRVSYDGLYRVINMTQWYFHHHSFNIILVSKGRIQRQSANITYNTTIINKYRQQVVNLINRKRQANIRDFNIMDNLERFSINANVHKFTNTQRQVVSYLFSDIVRKIGIHANFIGSIMETRVIIGVQYYLIMPNYRVVLKNQSISIIQIKDKISERTYNFTNPQLVLLYFENEITTELKAHCNQYYQFLSGQRLEQKANNLQRSTLRNKQHNQYAGSRVCVIDKYMGQQVGFLKHILNNYGIQLVFYSRTIQPQYYNQKFDAIVYISGSELPNNGEVQFIESQYRAGTGILLWADNDPFFKQANTILDRLQAGFSLIGNYRAQGTLRISKQLSKPGVFDINHPVSDGFVSLYQGITICYPDRLTSDFQIFAYSTNTVLQPSIFYRARYGGRGVLWIDTAFTKLFPSLHGSGKQSEQYTINVLKYIFKKKQITPY